MICSNCKRAVNNKAVVCPFCGESLSPQKENVKIDLPHDEHIDRKYADRQYAGTGAVHRAEAAASTADVPLRVREPKKKGRSFLIGLLIFLLLIGATAAAMYYAYTYLMGSSTKEYVSSISAINGRVNKVNNDMASVFNKGGNTLPVDELLKALPSAYSELDDIIEQCNKVVAPSNYIESHNKLEEGLKSNKAVYRQLESILKNPIDPDMDKNSEILSKYIEECSNAYGDVKIKDASFSLPDEIKSMPEKLEPWLKEKQDEYAEISNLMASFSKYFEDMSKLLLEFDSSRADLTQALNKTRNDNSSWDELFLLLDKNEKAVSSVKTKYIKLSVPSYIRTFNKRFGPILDGTLTYYSQLRTASLEDRKVKDEILFPEQAEEKEKEIEALYQEAEKVNASTTADYQKFTSDIEGEKNKYMNPEYVMTLKSGK